MRKAFMWTHRLRRLLIQELAHFAIAVCFGAVELPRVRFLLTVMNDGRRQL
jgi:hypothetical protein